MKKRRYIIPIAGLSVALALVTGLFIWYALYTMKTDNILEGYYQKSFADVSNYADNLDMSLSKLAATKDSQEQQKLLNKIAVQTALLEVNIAQMPANIEQMQRTAKFINQVGDYCKMLSEKLANGEKLNQKELDTINEFKRHCASVNHEFKSFANTSGTMNFRRLSKRDKGFTGDIAGSLKNLEELTSKIPVLIYDGPFSEGVDEIQPKFLNFEMIEIKAATQKTIELFPDFLDIAYSGDSNAKRIELYNFSAKTKDNEHSYIQLSKKGGKLIMFTTETTAAGIKVNKEKCLENAAAFLQKTEIPDMKPVWECVNGNIMTISFASVQNNVIIYPDMVKIKMSMADGSVKGFEAMQYYANHTEREIPESQKTALECRQNVSDNILIENERLVIIPKGNHSERLAYEFSGTFDGDTYYVYIDARTGRQVNILKVIKTAEGTLLM